MQSPLKYPHSNQILENKEQKKRIELKGFV